MAADTSWRTRPRRFPVRWLVPALTVVAATAVIGVLRYPDLPGQLSAGTAAPGGGRPVRTSPVTAFTPEIAQLYVTGLWTTLIVLIHRSRPDIDVAAPDASLRRYRTILERFTRTALTFLALVDLTFALAALQRWRFYQLSGARAVLLLWPAAAGLLLFAGVTMRTARERAWLAGQGQRPSPAAAGRDDDRFWKAGLVYVNRADPAIMVPARVSVGWSLNLGNPAAWLILAVTVGTAAGLALLRIAAGL